MSLSLFLDLVPAPAWLDSGHTAWQLTAATLVGLMSVPGLAIMYSGLMKRKWALNSALMVLYAFGPRWSSGASGHSRCPSATTS